jgi:hypothetical protein
MSNRRKRPSQKEEKNEIHIRVVVGSAGNRSCALVLNEPSLEEIHHKGLSLKVKIIYRAIAISLVMWIAKVIAQKALRQAGLRGRNEKIDQMSADSFPSSDPPSAWAGATE